MKIALVSPYDTGHPGGVFELIGHLRGGMSNSDLKEVGEMLDESEAALIVVGEATIERGVSRRGHHEYMETLWHAKGRPSSPEPIPFEAG